MNLTKLERMNIKMGVQTEQKNLLLEEIEKLKQNEKESKNILAAIERTNEGEDTNQDREIVSSFINNQLPYYRDVGLADQFTKHQVVLLAEQEKEEARLALETLRDQLHFLSI